MSLRLFAALELPPSVRDHLARLQRGVMGAKWRPPENFHLTLRFFGETSEPLAEELDHALAGIVQKPFEVRLRGAGFFGAAKPAALWIGVEQSEDLKVLAGRCERAARRAGLAPETRNFTPHVTLAYCAGTGVEDAAKFAQRLALFSTEPFLADRFGLYSSWTGKGPSKYLLEAEYPLVA